MTTVCITAAETRGVFQFHVDGQPTGIRAERITAATDSGDVVAECCEFIESLTGRVIVSVTHDKDTVFAGCE